MKTKITRELLRDVKPKQAAFDILDTEVRGFLARITPSGAISFGIRYTNAAGKQSRYSLRKAFPAVGVSEAREAARIKLGEIAAGKDPNDESKSKQADKITLGEFLDEHYKAWLVSNTKTGNMIANRIKVSFPTLLDKPLVELTGLMVEKWRSDRRESGMSASTTNRNITALRGLCSRAVEWGFLAQHPLANVKALKEPNGKVRWLSDDEETRLRNALDEREFVGRAERASANEWRRARKYDLLPDFREVAFLDHLKPMVLVSLNTGLRQGELFGLRWVDVKLDLEPPHLTIRDENTKSGQTRHIPLNDEALETLKLWQQQTPGDFVFPGPNGKPITEIKTAWGRLLKDAKIEDFRWHDMRHHFASRLVMAGNDLNTVRELLGHADMKMTLRYAHLSPEHKAAAVQTLMKRK
ncbi:site-specific integrase [Noviherbaspirillum galbum]|uniref:Site-specific integrase n=1 Tax=Noviherbaspirillum galbum TaxID=2709383 RepID=A0A6B3SY00_9BURK|nr:site-specific integrase [Noviherbaspirillum galbum]NEX63462.1 site-specific integrase [Noviherbaspirillum galbum]